jgi:hypothetical protein
MSALGGRSETSETWSAIERVLRKFEKALIDDVDVSALNDGERVPFSLSAIIEK